MSGGEDPSAGGGHEDEAEAGSGLEEAEAGSGLEDPSAGSGPEEEVDLHATGCNPPVGTICMFPAEGTRDDRQKFHGQIVKVSGQWLRCGKAADRSVAGFDACADCPSRFLAVLGAQVCCRNRVYAYLAQFVLYNKLQHGTGQPAAEMLDTGELSEEFFSGATIIKHHASCGCKTDNMKISDTVHFRPLGEFSIDYINDNIKEPGMAWQKTDELKMLKEAAAKQVVQQQSAHVWPRVSHASEPLSDAQYMTDPGFVSAVPRAGAP